MEPFVQEGPLTLARIQGIAHRHYGLMLAGQPLAHLLRQHTHAGGGHDVDLGQVMLTLEWAGEMEGDGHERLEAQGHLTLATVLGHPNQHVDVYLEQKALDALVREHTHMEAGARDVRLGRVTLTVEWLEDPPLDDTTAAQEAEIPPGRGAIPSTERQPPIPIPHTPTPPSQRGTEGATVDPNAPAPQYGETEAQRQQRQMEEQRRAEGGEGAVEPTPAPQEGETDEERQRREEEERRQRGELPPA